MIVLFAVVLVVHGLIHVLGFAKAFGVAELAQLTRQIGLWLGLLWLVAAVHFLAAAATLFVWPRGWWAIGAAATVVSMIVIVPSWTDARFGAIGNAIALIGVLFGFGRHPDGAGCSRASDGGRYSSARSCRGFLRQAGSSQTTGSRADCRVPEVVARKPPDYRHDLPVIRQGDLVALTNEGYN